MFSKTIIKLRQDRNKMAKKRIKWSDIHNHYINGLTPAEIIKTPEAKKFNLTVKQIYDKAHLKNWKEERRVIVEKTRDIVATKIIEKDSNGLEELTTTFKKRWEKILALTDSRLLEMDSDTEEGVKSSLDLSDLMKVAKITEMSQKSLAQLLQVPLAIKLTGDINNPIQIKMMAEARERLDKLGRDFDEGKYNVKQDEFTKYRHGIKDNN